MNNNNNQIEREKSRVIVCNYICIRFFVIAAVDMTAQTAIVAFASFVILLKCDKQLFPPIVLFEIRTSTQIPLRFCSHFIYKNWNEGLCNSNYRFANEKCCLNVDSFIIITALRFEISTSNCF